jgi:hypothetical protein
MIDRFRYRLNQYNSARKEHPSPEGLARAREALSPELFALFSRMLPFEQAHAIRVMKGVSAAGWQVPDLLAAALLHDVGKVRQPLRPWERALAVVVKALAPGLYRRWGRGKPTGWRAGIVVTAQHPAWGAEMVAAAGATEMVVWLIAHHQDESLPEGPEDRLTMLQALQSVDLIS